MARTIRHLAARIQRDLDGFSAHVEPSERRGYVMRVIHTASDRCVFTHDTGDRHTTLDDVDVWMSAMYRAALHGIVSASSIPDDMSTESLHELSVQHERAAMSSSEEELDEILDHAFRQCLEGCERTIRKRNEWDHGPSDWRVSAGGITLSHVDANRLIRRGLLEPIDSFSPNSLRLTEQGIRKAALRTKGEYDTLPLQKAIEHGLSLAYFHPDEDGEIAVPALYTPGSSKLVLVLGENAGGKSFFRRLFRGMTHPGRRAHGGDPAIPTGPYPVREFIGLSMELRTNTHGMGSMIYGFEQHSSTGELSARNVQSGIQNAQKRSHPTIIWWDEPDIGASTGAAAGIGQELARFVASDPPLVQAICITSHSTALVQQLAHLDPHYLYLGDAKGPATLEQWFEHQKNPKIISPDELVQISQERQRKIRKILKSHA